MACCTYCRKRYIEVRPNGNTSRSVSCDGGVGVGVHVWLDALVNYLIVAG